MNANLKKLLQNLLALIVLPVLDWYITLGDAVNVVDTEHASHKGQAVAWLFNEFDATGVWGFLGIIWIVCLILAIRSCKAWQKGRSQRIKVLDGMYLLEENIHMNYWIE